jgi:hypothetical protein
MRLETRLPQAAFADANRFVRCDVAVAAACRAFAMACRNFFSGAEHRGGRAARLRDRQILPTQFAGVVPGGARLLQRLLFNYQPPERHGLCYGLCPLRSRSRKLGSAIVDGVGPDSCPPARLRGFFAGFCEAHIRAADVTQTATAHLHTMHLVMRFWSSSVGAEWITDRQDACWGSCIE